MKKYGVLISALAFATILQAQIKDVTLGAGPVSQYEKAEFDIKLVEKWVNPYLQEDVALDMAIVTPSGKKLALPCYFESGQSGMLSLWKARFAPQEVGKYRCLFQLSKEGKVVDVSKTVTFDSKASKKNGFLHPKSNWVLEFDNGKPFRGVGENFCWESRANDDSKFFKALHEKEKYNYEYMLPLLAKNGVNFYRTWISSWNLPIDWQNGINNKRYTSTDEYFNPSAIKKFDRMIDLADSLDMYIMLTLGQGAGDRPKPNVVGQERPSPDYFFVNEQAKAKYKNRLRYIIGRWGYSTKISAWELFNEIDNVQFRNPQNPISAASIVKWHDEMSTYIKQIDPYKHLVTTSISHRDLEGLNSLPNIDINQKHIYKNTGIIPAQIMQYEKEFGKPYVIGEFGYEWDWSKNFDEFAEGMDTDYRRGLWYGLFTSTPILPMSWWWEYFEDRGMTTYFKGVREINDRMLVAGKGDFVPVSAKAGNLEAYSVKCGEQIFAYVFNATQDTLSADLTLNISTNSQYKVQSFAPSTCQYQNVSNPVPAGQELSFPTEDLKPNGEIVYILTPVR